MRKSFNFKKHREETLYESLQQVADRAGLTRMALSYLERGVYLARRSNYKKIAKGYRIAIDQVASACKARAS